MLVPRPRLLQLTAIGLVPLFAVAGSGLPAADVAAALAALTVLAAAFDALRAWPILDDFSASLAPVVRLVKGRPAQLALRLDHPNAAGRPLRIALRLPPALQSPESDRYLTLAIGPASPLEWPITPIRRGRYQIDSIPVESPSPWGLWARRRVLPVHCEVRVHPDLTRGFNANARFLSHGLQGKFAQRQIGKGREFDKLRDYIPGDASDEIHWKATAKRQQPVTKVFQLERTQEVYVIVDASRLAGRPITPPAFAAPVGRTDADAGPSRRSATPTEPLLESALTAALLLGAAAERQGDRFGLATFAETVQGFVRAKSGAAHFNACREMLLGLQPRLVSPDFEELASFLRVRLRHRVLLLFLTSLDDPVAAEGFLRGVDLLRKQHLCAVVQPQTPGVEPAFARDPASRVQHSDDLHRVLAGHLQWQAARDLELTLRRRGVTSITAPPAELARALTQHYLAIKRRQLL